MSLAFRGLSAGYHFTSSNAADDGLIMKTTTPGASEGSGAAAAPEPALASTTLSGLQFNVCTSLAEVNEAWEFVRGRYQAEGILRDGREADAIGRDEAGPETAVVVGKISGLVVSTVTLIGDESGKKHLPMDRE